MRLRVDNLSVTSIAGRVDDVSFEVRAGECVGLVGLRGSGSSTVGDVVVLNTGDATRVRADALGHTLFGNQAFLADLSSLLAEGKSPAERRLLAVKRGDLVFYRFRGDPR